MALFSHFATVSGTGWRQARLIRWLIRGRCANLDRCFAASNRSSRPMKLALLLPLMTLLTVTSVDPLHAQGFSFSQPDDTDKQEQAAREARIADDAVGTLPRRAQGQEDHGGDRRAAVERLHRGAAAELRRALPGDQQAAAGARACAPTRPRRSAARSRRPRSTRISATTPTRRSSASRRLGASFVLRGLISSQATPNPMMAVNQVSVNMGFTLTGEQRPRDLRHRGEFELLCGLGRPAHGADARQREGRRGRREAVRRLLPQCGASRSSRARRPRDRLHVDTIYATGSHVMKSSVSIRCLQSAARRALVVCACIERRRAAAIRQSVADGRQRDVAAGQCLGRPGDLQAGRVHERQQEGSGADRHPRRDQEQQRDVPAEVHGEQHRRLRRDRAVGCQLPGARALESRADAEGVRACLQPRRSAGRRASSWAWASSRARSTSSSSTS